MKKIIQILISVGLVAIIGLVITKTDAAGTVAPAIPQIGGDIHVVHSNGSGFWLNATTSSDVGRGTALLTAWSASSAGDHFYLASSTFTIGATNLDAVAKRISITGAGPYSTTIVSSFQSVADGIIKPGANTTVENLGITCVTSPSVIQIPYGGTNMPLYNALLKNVYINCGSDAVLLSVSQAATSTLVVRNLVTDSQFDSFNISQNDESGSGIVPCRVDIYDSELRQKPGTENSGQMRGVVNAGCDIHAYNTNITSTGGATENIGYNMSRDPNATTTVSGGKITTSGTSAYDFQSTGAGSKIFAITADTAYDSSKTTLLGNATITYADANPIIQAIRRATDIFSVGSTSPVSTARFLVGTTTPSIYVDSGNAWVGIGASSLEGCTDCTLIVGTSSLPGARAGGAGIYKSGGFRVFAPQYAKTSWVSAEAPVNSKKYQLYVGPSGQFHLGALNDAENSEGVVWDVQRSATTITGESWGTGSTAFTFNGNLSASQVSSEYFVGPPSGELDLGDVHGDNTGRYFSYNADTGIAAFHLGASAEINAFGINNASPSYALDVTGDANVTGCYRVNTTCLTNSQWTTTGSDIYYSMGKAGIGTTTPAFTLDINGTTLHEPSTAPSFANGSTYSGLLWNDSTNNQLTYTNKNVQSIGGRLYSATADVTLNSATPTTAFSTTKVGTTTIAANSLKAGQRFTIWGAGYYSTPIGNTATVTITPSIASTTATNISTVTTAIFPASASNLPYDFRLNCTVRSIGAQATLVCDGTFNYATALTGVSPTSNSLSTVGTIKFDSTVREDLNVKVNWSAVTTQTATVQESWIDF